MFWLAPNTSSTLDRDPRSKSTCGRPYMDRESKHITGAWVLRDLGDSGQSAESAANQKANACKPERRRADVRDTTDMQKGVMVIAPADFVGKSNLDSSGEPTEDCLKTLPFYEDGTYEEVEELEFKHLIPFSLAEVL